MKKKKAANSKLNYQKKQLTKFFSSDLSIIGISIPVDTMTSLQIMRSFFLVTFFSFTLLANVLLLFLLLLNTLAFFFIHPALLLAAVVFECGVFWYMWKNRKSLIQFLQFLIFFSSSMYIAILAITQIVFVEYRFLFIEMRRNYLVGIMFYVGLPYMLYPLTRGIAYIVTNQLTKVELRVSLYKRIHDSVIVMFLITHIVLSIVLSFIVARDGFEMLLEKAVLQDAFEYVLIAIGLIQPFVMFGRRNKR